MWLWKVLSVQTATVQHHYSPFNLSSKNRTKNHLFPIDWSQFSACSATFFDIFPIYNFIINFSLNQKGVKKKQLKRTKVMSLRNRWKQQQMMLRRRRWITLWRTRMAKMRSRLNSTIAGWIFIIFWHSFVLEFGLVKVKYDSWLQSMLVWSYEITIK